MENFQDPLLNNQDSMKIKEVFVGSSTGWDDVFGEQPFWSIPKGFFLTKKDLLVKTSLLVDTVINLL